MEEFLTKVKALIAKFDTYVSDLQKLEPHTSEWEDKYGQADSLLTNFAILLLDKALDSDMVRKWQSRLDLLRTRLAAANLSAITDDRKQSTQIIDANALTKQVQIDQMCDAIQRVLDTFHITLDDLIHFRTVNASYSLGDMLALRDIGGCCYRGTVTPVTSFATAMREADRGVITCEEWGDCSAGLTPQQVADIESDMVSVIQPLVASINNAKTVTARVKAQQLTPEQLRMYRLLTEHNERVIEAHRRLQEAWKTVGKFNRLMPKPRFIVPL